jgi:hypothetical protein
MNDVTRSACRTHHVHGCAEILLLVVLAACGPRAESPSSSTPDAGSPPSPTPDAGSPQPCGAGGSAPIADLIATSPADIVAAAAADGDVFWGNALQCVDACFGEIFVTGADGVTTRFEGAQAVSIDVDATTVAWAHHEDFPPFGRVSSKPRVGGPRTVADSGRFGNVALGAGGVVASGTFPTPFPPNHSEIRLYVPGASPVAVLTSDHRIGGLAADANAVYWGDFADGSILRAVPGQAPTTLASGQNALTVRVEGSNVYWINTDGSVMSVPVMGGPVTLVSNAGGRPVSGQFVVHSPSIYWMNQTGTNTADLICVPITGAESPTIVLSNLSIGVRGLTANDKYLYFGMNKTLYRVLR